MKFVFLFIGYFLFIYSVSAQTPEPIVDWIVQTPTSLQITNGSTPSQTTISSTSSSNIYNIAITPRIVLSPCSFTTTSNPYISVEVADLSANGLASTNSSIIMGYATANNAYEFEVINTIPKSAGATCPNQVTEIRKYINGASNGLGQVACYTVGGSPGDKLQLDIVLQGGQYELHLKRTRINAPDYSTISTMAITPGDGRFYIKLKHKNTSAAAVRNIQANYPCTNSTFFNELKPSLDGSFAALYDDKLRIKYIQNYATINATAMYAPDPVPYTIRNWNNSVNINGTFDAAYGINWIALSISSLPTNQFYTIEVVGNKGEKSYLRFKR